MDLQLLELKTKGEIVSYLDKSEKNLISPQKLGNADVISISNNAFQGISMVNKYYKDQLNFQVG